MLKLKDYRHKQKSLPDLLSYAAMVDNGIVLCKNGALLAGWIFRSQDTASSTPQELATISARVNQALAPLGSGWMCHVEAIRTPATGYPAPATSFFPDRITAMIDEERRNIFESGEFYTTSTFLAVTCTPQLGQEKIKRYATGQTGRNNQLDKQINEFKKTLFQLEDSLSLCLQLERLADYTYEDEFGNSKTVSPLLTFLQICTTGENHPVILPSTPMYLDAIIGCKDLIAGDSLFIGKNQIQIIAIDGFPAESWPSILSCLEGTPLEYRFSSRFICMDQFEAEKELTLYRKTWQQQVFKFFDLMFNKANPRPNQDALNMAGDAETALAEVQSGLVSAGFYTACIVLHGTDPEKLEDNTRLISRLIQGQGFGCRIETINALEAWLGTHPGNAYANVRRPIVNSMNLSDMLPLATIWPGNEFNPSPEFPANSPALMYCATDGSTPFRLNLHTGDIGHTLIFGPTGAGKSTLLGIINAQFRRYKNASIFAFDKGMSMFPLCKAAGGTHYEIAGDDSELAFAPLSNVDSDAEQAWAEEWIETLVTLQGFVVLPAHRNAIHLAMNSIRNNPKDMRSLTDFYHFVQDEELREAIKHYTNAGAMGHLLDAKTDGFGIENLMVFEIENLMNLGDKNLIPVLLYLFHCIEKSFKGQPSLLILDEAWIMLGHKVFRDKIYEWLKVLRKANCAVVLATQSLEDAAKSGLMGVLSESCPTKIYLANPSASDKDQRPHYEGLGLNSTQIQIITSAAPKRDYYVVTPEGRRLINLALGPVALSFVGSSGKGHIARIKELEKEHGPSWPEQWLEERQGDFKWAPRSKENTK
ncbi:conjugal transfer protein TrbE [Maridesulfovibrio salexigens]|uniref:CagE TrbE VirB component of type IV transporter system n=1 Tax=Maridesulfovibrio salexigens (strain ATCC 14822 / DSM 2638 / NCIMB 8403 / VKM B-1763) TaxID=526222 RepID=C6BT64_MARSD|nr:conjugal transfer protein TrbE [Maridesulfovibrio salexigens]ACS79768.1 CagE TrbE VirB component of type IV transporter system [Maridesulfovibrio salexigens DSM 2638]